MADSTLEAIRKKVRRLTKSPSPSNITNDEIDEYINTFISYDLPEHVRLFTNKKNFYFFAQPYVGEYPVNTINADDPLYDFKNKYTAFHGPAYCAGYQLAFTQDQAAFNATYTTTQFIETLDAVGDGITTNFIGTLSSNPIVQNSVLFNSIDAGDSGIALIDQPIVDPVTGIISTIGSVIGINSSTYAGVINYITGEYNITFPTAPAANENIHAQTLPYLPSRPTTVLYFKDTFFLRPIPDQVYEIQLQTDVVPTELINNNDVPDIKSWSQYIAYGAAKKVYEDRMDLDSVALLMPEFNKQEKLVERRSTNQKAREKVKTVFNSGTVVNNSPFYKR